MSSKMKRKVYPLVVLTLLISMVTDAKADYVFGTRTKLGPTVNSAYDDGGVSLSAMTCPILLVQFLMRVFHNSPACLE